jgi:UDP-N-acetylmuramyl pentapeptide phosphotransferase/UDP-N-acetylglucosamine-1-phosphate transferase
MAFEDLTLMLAAGLFCAALIVLLRPVLMRHALAHPNARSSHAKPTPQGGGIAVVAATLVTLVVLAAIAADARMALGGTLPLAGAVILLAVVGAIDDIYAIAMLPRLIAQALAVGAVVATLPEDLRAVPVVPVAIERAFELLAGLWFVNLVNFMDGIDWMTVAETVPVTAAIFAFSLMGAVAPGPGLVALALCGAMLGFAPFNRPVATLFLGDVGSLPIGIILFWLLLQLAGNGYLGAAVLLPLYYLADASVTLLRRIARGENITQAHRSHFYQLATARGFSVPTVAGTVFALNILLAALADASIHATSPMFDVVALAIGGALVGAVLAVMERGRR